MTGTLFRSPLSASRRTAPPRSAKELSLAGNLMGAIDMARMSAGMTHEALADRLGYSRAYITMLQTHKKRWTVEAVLKVCRVTGDYTPIHWICREVGGKLVLSAVSGEIAKKEAELRELRQQQEREEAA